MQKVLNNKDLIQLIVGHIDDPRDFRNFRVVSKKFLAASKKVPLIKKVSNIGYHSVYFVSRLSGRAHGLSIDYRKNGTIAHYRIMKHGHMIYQMSLCAEGNIEELIYKTLSFRFYGGETSLILEIRTERRASLRMFKLIDGEWKRWNMSYHGFGWE